MSEGVLTPDHKALGTVRAACWLLEEGRPGRFLGYGTVVEATTVVLHPRPNASSRSSRGAGRLPPRSRVRTKIGKRVLDGTLADSAV